MAQPSSTAVPGCRIGFVGTGSVAERHARVLSGFDDVELVAATDVDPERAAAFAREHGLRVVDGTAGLLVERLDAVYVCVPPSAHGAEVELAAGGVALFVEKPLAADLATAEWIDRRLRAARVPTGVGHHWRCAEPVRRARELLAGRPIRLVTGTWVDKIPPVAWWTNRLCSGGPLVEQAVHVLDLARVLVGEVHDVRTVSAGPVPGCSVDAATATILRFAGGAVGTFATSCVANAKHRTGLEIVADGLVVGVGEDWLEVHDADGRRHTEYDPWAARVAADRAFIDTVRGAPVDTSAPPDLSPPGYVEALRTHRLACAMARSAAEAARVRPARRPPASDDRHPAGRPDRALVVEAPGVAAVREVPPAEGPMSVRTICTGVSAGTELSFLTGTNPALHHSFDRELGLFRGDVPGTGYPVTRLGYMEVARVESNDGPGPTPGSTVAMTYGHRTAFRTDPLRERVVELPSDLDPLLGVYVAHMGPICANGLLHAAADAVGTDVRDLGDGVRGRRVVVGGGVVGLLTGSFARRYGAEHVVVVDPTPSRRAAAEGLGLDTLDPDRADPAVVLKSRWRRGPGDRGADVVFQCRGRTAALAVALRVLRPQGTVVDLAFYTDDGAALRLGAEFHHNGLGIRCAQIGRVPRGTAHVWDRERLSTETIGLLLDDGPAIRKHLITDVVPLEDGPALLTDLAARRRHVIQAVLTVD